MRYLTIVVILATAILAASCQLAEVGPEAGSSRRSVAVMSYNIHYGVGTDGETDLARIARVITESGADVVGLQEIGNAAMAKELGRLTRLHSVFGASKGSDGGYGDAVLSRYPFTWVGNHAIPSASSSRYQAMAVDVDLSELYGDGVSIRFINTHFDWLESLGSQEARLGAIAVIERAFARSSPGAAVLVGDLNASPDSAPLRRLRELGWAPCRATVATPTWEATNPTRQIDYVLTRPSQAWNVREMRVLDEPLASDHLPVVSVLELVHWRR